MANFQMTKWQIVHILSALLKISQVRTPVSGYVKHTLTTLLPQGNTFIISVSEVSAAGFFFLSAWLCLQPWCSSVCGQISAYQQHLVISQDSLRPATESARLWPLLPVRRMHPYLFGSHWRLLPSENTHPAGPARCQASDTCLLKAGSAHLAAHCASDTRTDFPKKGMLRHCMLHYHHCMLHILPTHLWHETSSAKHTSSYLLVPHQDVNEWLWDSSKTYL